ncbi:uncharacterized protein K452DRAFT_160966 [Aplosporella prunicola CBS 121167]|uniref:Glutaredoxin domain-containing protein n=1 Tax=Aplosporella prunicola CBS 121167 TaxID=1176127 RepID=A0A6A6BMC0_9PEZI|nr:uncharacterized protein K452DRAFT_160966 [Aplosporella prunicola CBS 121167]KAF2143691.1 hypothetical protein K452DRAFT_160966 [Aplosporella prunicola CBS 121167]
MPPSLRSQRRLKAMGLLVFLAVLTTLYLTSAARQTRNSDFYQRTQGALAARERAAVAAAEAELEAQAADFDVGKRLKAAEEKAKKSANNKGDRIQEVVAAGKAEKEKERVGDMKNGGAATKDDAPEHDEITGEKSVAGRISLKDSAKDDGVAKVGKVGDSVKGHTAATPSKAGEEEKSDEDREVELELNAILKKSPIIIFSKSYCPYSAKAKRILLESYAITPRPYVVELDQHPLGAGLQAALAKSTGRGTVPNILINGRSIGGGDDVESLQLNGRLAETVHSMGGKRVTEVKEVDPNDAAAAAAAADKKDSLKRRRVKRVLNA